MKLALPVLLSAAAAALAAEPSPDARWPALASGPLQDNSFFIEEAYNQERGVVQHIVNGLWDRKSGDWLMTVTDEWPAPSQTHQLSFTLPLHFDGDPGGGRGVGDLFLNYRYQALFEGPRRPAVAPRVSLIVPTGSVSDGRGKGSAGGLALIPVSKQMGEHFAGHLNLFGAIVPHALTRERPGDSAQLTTWGGGGSLIWEPFAAINFLTEVVAARDEDLTARGEELTTQALISPGARVAWNGPEGLQLVWGLAFPVGLTSATDDFGVFLYFSAEHAVTAEARKERSW